MKEHPIIFSAPMVQAILKKQKTETRRVIVPQPVTTWGGPLLVDDAGELWEPHPGGPPGEPICLASGKPQHCPYGVPGDLLYVKERMRVVGRLARGRVIVEYMADGERMHCNIPETHWDKPTSQPSEKFHNARFMPKWAARIWHEATTIDVERVQDITEDGAIAEGASPMHLDDLGQTWKTHRRGFRTLWDSINLNRGYGWDVNPRVYAVGHKLLSTTGRPEAHSTAEKAGEPT